MGEAAPFVPWKFPEMDSVVNLQQTTLTEAGRDKCLGPEGRDQDQVT